MPRAGIYIYVSIPEIFLLKEIETLTVTGKNIPGFASRTTFSSSEGKTKLVWCPKTDPVIGFGEKDTQITSVVFHIFNYKDFFGTRSSIEQTEKKLQMTKHLSQHSIGHLDLKSVGWYIELKSLVTTGDTFKTLGEIGGYGLTHVGRLQKEDGTSFDGKTAEKILNTLRHFFSFSKGMWCNPCLAVGFDDKENRVWESCSSPQGCWAKPSS